MKIVKLHLRETEDADLIAFWESLPYGSRSKAVVSLWRRGLQSGQSEEITLAAIRQVFDAALSGLTFVASDGGGMVEEEDLLDGLDEGLLLD